MWRHWLLLISFFLFNFSASAVQFGIVIVPIADVYELPGRLDLLIERLEEGLEVPLSSKSVEDLEGKSWFKTRLSSGAFGYILASSVQPESVLREKQLAGISPLEGNRLRREGDSWAFQIRALGSSGAFLGETPKAAFGGELEGSICIFLWKQGYARRRVSLGLAGHGFDGIAAGTLSLIYRIFAQSRFEPEVRLRYGRGWSGEVSADDSDDASDDASDGISSNSFGEEVLGFTLGVRYPLSLKRGSHWSLTIEGGGFGSRTGDFPTMLGVSAGLGYHF
jgi:hypothetical protein